MARRKTPRGRLVVVDGHSQIYRAIHGGRAQLTGPTGEATRGPYYFTRMLRALVRTRRPDYLAVAMDSDRRRYVRRRHFPGYKAKRPDEVDPSIPSQFWRVRQILRRWGVPTLEVEGWEADDVVATLAARFSRWVDVLVVSRDKDLHQLVSDSVVVFDPQDGSWWGPAEVEARWGLPPSKLVDVQTLMGDSVDGVPGVPGIGQKRAVDLVSRYDSVAGVLENLEDLPEKTQQAVRDTDLELSRFLVELRADLHLDVELEDLRYEGLDHARAAPIFEELGIRRWSRT